MPRSIALTWVFLLVCAAQLDAWGVRGHRIVNRAAVEAIPDDGPVFVKQYIHG